MKPFTFLKTAGLLILILDSGITDAQYFKWARRTGGTGNDFINGIKTDKYYNVYCIGEFQGSVDIDPGQGVHTVIQEGNPNSSNTFIQKLDSSGRLLWGGQLLSTQLNMDIDDSGNLYISGSLSDTMDVDLSLGIFNLYPSNGRVFIIRFNSDGLITWARQFGPLYTTNASALAVSGKGDIYIAGSFQGTVDFDPGQGIFTLTAPPSRIHSFVLKFNSWGKFLWVGEFKSSKSASTFDLCTDAVGNVYGTGSLYGTTDFDPGPGYDTLTCIGASTDVFTFKLDASGFHKWARLFTGPYPDNGYGIAVNNSGETYVTGLFDSIVDFNPAGGGYFMNDFGGKGSVYDVYLAKFDQAGNFVWARQFGGVSDERSYDIAVDIAGGVYVSGFFLSPDADFDPGPDTLAYTAASLDAFTVKIGPQGNYIWSQSISSPGVDEGFAVYVDHKGNLYTGGTFEQTLDMDPGSGLDMQTSEGKGDAFVQKLGQSGISGLQTYQAGNYISVYPNPAGSQLTIRCTAEINELSIFDATGRPYYQINTTDPVNELQIPDLHLTSGIYFILVKTGNNTITRKFIRL